MSIKQSVFFSCESKTIGQVIVTTYLMISQTSYMRPETSETAQMYCTISVLKTDILSLTSFIRIQCAQCKYEAYMITQHRK